ncbi:uncharacterized protein LOC135842048 [Planococcus citri]|uniref:uncharacterized protein LOC135842048 n=1 Tax=Planococcus citri TaxID=170843 RepID=UPI0031F98046
MSNVMSTSSWSHEEPIAIALLEKKDLTFNHLKNGQIELAADQAEPGEYTKCTVDEMVGEWFFQDNTKLFPVIIQSENPVAFIFPPGSGKSSLAQLFESYASNSKSIVGAGSDKTKMNSFFETCWFALNNSSLYTKYRSNCAVVYIDFRNIVIEQNEQVFYRSLKVLMCAVWNKYAPEEFLLYERKHLKKDISAVCSLQRLVVSLLAQDRDVFVLLDSCDVVFNQLANLDRNRKDRTLSQLLLMFLQCPTETTLVKYIYLGVNPYFAVNNLRHNTDVYSIYVLLDVLPEKEEEYEENRRLVRECFSYSKESIEKACEHMKLENIDEIVERCTRVAEFSFNGFELINPYLATAYLTTLKSRSSYSVNIAPRSLWHEAIFTERDVDIIAKSLTNDTTAFSFPMLMSSTHILTSFSQDRRWFYNLFIYGGYFSGETINNNQDEHMIRASNQTTKLVLKYMLENIWKKKYQTFTMDNRQQSASNQRKRAGNRQKPAKDESGYKSKLRKRR